MKSLLCPELDRLKSKQESSRFLKKAAQKLLRLRAGGVETSTAQEQKSFFASFCSQKEGLPLC
jgi:hypothetical protein